MDYTFEEFKKKCEIRAKNEEDFIREFIKKIGEITHRSEIKNKVIKLLIDSVKKEINAKYKIGVLFSGGIDSTTICVILKKLGVKFTAYVCGIGESDDVKVAKKVSKKLKLDLKVLNVKENEIESYLKKIISVIKSTDVTKVGVAFPFYVCLEQMKKDKIDLFFSGLGSEEIFAGYERHKKSENVNKECIRGLLTLKNRDLIRDRALADFFKIKLATPFLEESLVDYCLRIPGDMKIKDGKEKLILRLAGKDLGVPSEVVNRKKKAAQYGSNSTKFIEKLTKKNKFKLKKEYLESLS